MTDTSKHHGHVLAETLHVVANVLTTLKAPVELNFQGTASAKLEKIDSLLQCTETL